MGYLAGERRWNDSARGFDQEGERSVSDPAAARQALKDRLLEAALMHAAFDGWGGHTLANAAADAGIDAATARRLFPRGGDSLLEWLDDWADRRMLERTAGEKLEALPVARRIARLVRARFEALAPHREAVRRAVLARGLPHNLPGGMAALWRTVDRIWQAAGFPAGERRTLDHYTRRALLAGILVATLFYWLEDQSEDCRDSWAFLDRRLEEVLRYGRLSGRLRDFLRTAPGGGGR